MASVSGTSFHKRSRVKIGQIPGTRPSIYNNQLLISTGIPSLDSVIGGGLAVGTVLLVEEDIYGSYARLMLKYFIAEAVMTKQSVFLCSAKENPQLLLKELPEVIGESPTQSDAKTTVPANASAKPQSSSKAAASGGPVQHSEDEKMTIAWRYQNKPKVQSSPSSSGQFGHYYDLTRTMNTDTVAAADIFCAPSPVTVGNSDVKPAIAHMNPHYCQLLQEIKSRIQTGCFSTRQEAEKRSILRIGIHSLGSPLWGENGGLQVKGHGHDPSLALFLIALRGVLRSAFASAMITVPSHLFHDSAFVRRIQRLGDTVIRLESFAGSDKEKNPVFKEYHGLFHLIQLPRLNSLVPPHHETSDLAFKLRRKKFTIEKLHLPPELADTTGRSEEDNSLLSKKSSLSSCSSSDSSKLSF